MKMRDQTSYLIKIYRKRKTKPIIFETSNKEQFDSIFESLLKHNWIMISDIILRCEDIKYIVREEI